MGSLRLNYAVECHPLAAPFRVSGRTIDSADAVVAELTDGQYRGRGEAAGVYYLNDNPPEIVEMLEANREAIETCPSRDELRRRLPPGGARNAVDCAMWELEAKQGGTQVWRLAGIPEPKPLITVFTLSADEPAAMAASALDFANARSLKIKLTGDLDLDSERVRAVRSARPDVWLGVDANQGFKKDQLDQLGAMLAEHRVSLLEQPLARGREAELENYHRAIPIVADESVGGIEDLPGLVGRFDVVNIKLDKCGGLTEALMVVEEARRLGLGVMVGNMPGTSLAMAPAFVLGQQCDLADLDGAFYLREDRTPSVEYREGMIWCPDQVWGSGAAA
jgi:L-alanine-DL-glutamate epimerase-like enolase superfamily enzyme